MAERFTLLTFDETNLIKAILEAASSFPWAYVTQIAFATLLCFLLSFLIGGCLSLLFKNRAGILLRLSLSLIPAFGAAALLFYLKHDNTAFPFFLLGGTGGSLVGFYLGLGSGIFKAPGPDSLEFAIAKRISFRTQRSVSGLLIFLGVISIALSIAVMEISISILFGYKREIQNKVVGFGSHILVTDYTEEQEARFVKLPMDAPFAEELRKKDDISSVAPYVIVPGMVQNENNLEGVLMKGVEAKYDWSFFREHLLDGKLPDFSDSLESKEVLISKKLSRLLDLKTGSKLMFYYFEEKPRVRKLQVTGIYETGLEEFDAANILCDIRLLQRLVNFSGNEAMGFEVNLKSLETLEQTTEEVHAQIPSQYIAMPITERFPEIFDWLEVQHQNVWAIIFLMALIAVINMITVTLITILERTRTIGILKALGMPKMRIMGIFIRNTFFVILAGVLLGNVLGFGLIALQENTGLIQVSQESYLVQIVPVKWVWDHFLLINAGVVIVCTLFTWLPTRIISRISPLEALRFE